VLKNNLKLLLEDGKNDIDMINCMTTKTTIIRSSYPNVKLQVSIPGDSDWYSRPYIFFILRKKYSKP
jgi:hypothetical protein